MSEVEDLVLKIKLLADVQDSVGKLKELELLINRLKKATSGMQQQLNKMYTAGEISPQEFRDASNSLDKYFTSYTRGANNAANGLNKVTTAAKSAGGGLFSLTNILRTALGTFEAMGIFLATKFVTDLFGGALKASTEMRKSFASLNFAESILSQKGMDITRKELDDLVKFIEDKYKYLSTLEVTGIVSTVADMGAEFNLTKEQLSGLTEAVAFLQLKEKAYGQEVSDVGSIVNAALDGRSNFFNRLGINITKTAIAEKAYAMGIVANGAALTKEQSNQAAIALLIEQTAGKWDELLASIEEVNPAMANQLRIDKEMQNSQLVLGEAILAVKDRWNEFMSTLIENGDFASLRDGLVGVFDSVGDLVGILQTAYYTIKDLGEATNGLEKSTGLEGWLSPLNAILTVVQAIYLGFTTIIGAVITAIGIVSEFINYATGEKTYEEAGNSIGKHFADGLLKGIAIGLRPLVAGKNDPVSNSLRQTMLLFGGGDKPKPQNQWSDTPTSPANNTEKETEDLQKALEKLNNEILEAQLKLAQDMEEAQIDLGRKLVDIAKEYSKKRADVEKDYASKVSDINNDYSERVRDIQNQQAEDNDDYRNKEKDREAQFQEQMRQLKENYLMDLEDALHARDARQVQRLTKQYALDKEQAERKHKLDQQSASREHVQQQRQRERELIEAEHERQVKLQKAQQERNDKIEELKLNERLEQEAAQVAYQRKLEDLQREMHDRLEIVSANLVQEFNLTKDGLDALAKLYRKYYDNVSDMYKAMMHMVNGMANMSSGGGVSGGTSGRSSRTGGGRPNPIPMAEGGTIIANRPTTVLFGEAGLERAEFTPLNRSGNNAGKVFSNSSDNMGGKAVIEVSMSPDLVAKMVESSLNGTANVILKTMRGIR